MERVANAIFIEENKGFLIVKSHCLESSVQKGASYWGQFYQTQNAHYANFESSLHENVMAMFLSYYILFCTLLNMDKEYF